MVLEKRLDIIGQLRSEILRLQPFGRTASSSRGVKLGPINDSFPDGCFPIGAVHEFLAPRIEDAAATTGFIGGLLASMTGTDGIILWISSSRILFPPALKTLGLAPEHFIFLDVRKEKDVLWAMDEALKCGALTAVVGEMKELSFTESRRLQLAVEHSAVTGFILRHTTRKPTTTACVSRWKITTLPSVPAGDLPGIGFPAWRVELIRIRNGKPGTWDIQLRGGMFAPVNSEHGPVTLHELQQQAG